jgi:hypothetical protein
MVAEPTRGREPLGNASGSVWYCQGVYFQQDIWLTTIKPLVFNNILGYPGGHFKSSFIFNNILGYTFILTIVQACGPADSSCQLSLGVPTILF